MALANIGDMMSLHSFETKHIIMKGLNEDNIHNPFRTCGLSCYSPTEFNCGDDILL